MTQVFIIFVVFQTNLRSVTFTTRRTDDWAAREGERDDTVSYGNFYTKKTTKVLLYSYVLLSKIPWYY